MKSSGLATAVGLISLSDTSYAAVHRMLEALVAQQRVSARSEAGTAGLAGRRSVAVVLGGAALAVLLSTVATWWCARLIARPLGRAARVLKAVAAGDLTQELPVEGRDEVGQAAEAVNEAVGAMRHALREVGVAARETASASRQVSEASRAVSSGAQEQASSLEETAASLEELTGTSRQNAENARQANQLAAGSRDAAQTGGEVVGAAVAAMDDITRTSKTIAAITTSIDEIAFQTNLLALNAAVESARAGEHGRGFAVVASEVRNLAQRAAAAAKEIKGLINTSLGKVEIGSARVAESRATLAQIATSVTRVTEVIAEIAAASGEQTTGIDQVSQAVTQMDQIVQANAAQTEELSSTAEILATQAEHLQALVGRFNIGDEADAGRPEAAPVPRAARPRPAAPAHTRQPAVALAAAGARRGSRRDDAFEEF
jgi:methyl-accepting chemotaxis protein